MSSRGRRSNSRSPDSRKSGRRDKDRPWIKSSKSRSRSSSSSSSSSRSRSSRRRNKRSRSRSRSPVVVRPVMSKDSKYVNARVFVANLASTKLGTTDLEDLFKKHGRITDSLVHHNGYGFVQFANEEDARMAAESETGTYFFGKVLRCNMAAEKGKREDGGDDGERNGRGRDRVGRDRDGGWGRDRDGGGGRDSEGRNFEGRNFGGRGGGGRHEMTPPNERFPRDRSRSPGRDPFGPPPGFGDPYFRGRDMPPPPRDFRDLGPRDLGPRDLGPPMPRDFYPPRDPRDLPPPPRDPFLDDPYRRHPPPDPYFDRFRDDPYRRDPYRMDPFRDPYRDAFAPSLYDPVATPKKPMAVDCEIIVMSPDLRRYADTVEKRLKNINLLTNVMVIREDQTIQEQVEDAARRNCLFAISLNSQNEKHRSLTLTILHGVTQEHRNMPLDDAVDLVERSFQKFLSAEKEKLAAKNKDKPGEDGAGEKKDEKKSGSSGPIHPKGIDDLLALLVENRPLSVEELDKLIDYLQEKKDKVLGIVRKPKPQTSPAATQDSALPQEPSYSQQLPQSQYQQQSPHYQQRRQPSPPPSDQDPQRKILNMMKAEPAESSSALQSPQQQQQPQYQRQQQPQPPFHQQSAHYQQQQQQPPPQQDPHMKLLSMMQGESAAPTHNSVPQNTLTSHTTPLLPATVVARPPPPPPPPEPQPSPNPNPSPTQGVQMRAGAAPHPSHSSPSPLSSASAPVVSIPATLIDFDNPTVQRALDNLIQSGPNLLKNISATAGCAAWPAQGTALATSQQQVGGYPAGAGRTHQQQQGPY